MKKSVNLYFNYCADSTERIKEIKKQGYNEFFTGIYDKPESLTWQQQLKLANDLGLGCTMMHCSYYEPDLNAFWEENELGDAVCEKYIKQIQECGAYCNNFVVHLNGSKGSKQSEIGLKRIMRMLKECEKHNVNLCIENLYSAQEIPYIFSNISHPLLKICYDCGHKNFLTPEFDVCKQYGRYITTLHLHENNGIADEHKKLTVGSNVFKGLEKDLEYITPNITLAAEIKYKGEDWQQYLQENLDVLNILENNICLHNFKK